MPLSSSLSLQQSLYGVLTSNANLVSLLGGPNIHDDVPRDAGFPFVTIGETVSRDWSTGTEEGEEHLVTLHVWSRGGGKKKPQEIISAVKAALHDQPVAVTDHHLVNLRLEFSDLRRSGDGEHYHGIVRYRAVTEPIN